MPEKEKIIMSRSDPPAEVRQGTLVYNFNECLLFLESKGKELFGKHFKIYPEDRQLIYKLLVYIIGDEVSAGKFGLDIRKGILLTGPVGCGKSCLMALLRFFQPEPLRYQLKSCRDISFEFIQNGYETIFRYSRGYVNEQKINPKHYCFDDLGTENNLKYYGNECNVMGEILLSRYDLFVSRMAQTYLTTNLTSSELEQCYGNRVRSRLREMFNLVAFDKSSKDKR